MGSRGIPTDLSRLRTQSQMFLETLKGILSCFILKKNRLQHLGPKKVESSSDVEFATKNSEVCCDIVCVDTPIAATVAVTAGGESLLICRNILFVSLLPLTVHGRSKTPPVVTAMSHPANPHLFIIFILDFSFFRHKLEPISTLRKQN